MMPLHIVAQPERRYDGHGKRVRGAARTGNMWSRTLALFDRLGGAKRANRLNVALSNEGAASLARRALALDVHPAGLAAFLIESALAADRCRAGHELTPDNVIKEKDGTRRCRTCRRAYDQQHNARASA